MQAFLDFTPHFLLINVVQRTFSGFTHAEAMYQLLKTTENQTKNQTIWGLDRWLRS